MSEHVILSCHSDSRRISFSSQWETFATLTDEMMNVHGVVSVSATDRYSYTMRLGKAFDVIQVAAELLSVWMSMTGSTFDDLEVVEQGFPEGISIAHKARRWHRLDRIGELTRRIEDLASEIRLNNAVLKRQRADLRTFRQELEELCAEELEELDGPVVNTSEDVDSAADESGDES